MERSKPADKRRRKVTTTPEQDELIRKLARQKGEPEHVVFRAIVDAGFAAYANGGQQAERPSKTGAFRNGIRSIEEQAAKSAAAADEAKTAGMASLAATVWTGRSALGLLRWTLQALGQNVDDPRIPWCQASRFMSTADCDTVATIFEECAAHLASGKGLDEALGAACREAGIPWAEFSGEGAARKAGQHQNPGTGKAMKRRKDGKEKGSHR